MQCDLIGQVMDEWVRVHVRDSLGVPHMGMGIAWVLEVHLRLVVTQKKHPAASRSSQQFDIQGEDWHQVDDSDFVDCRFYVGKLAFRNGQGFFAMACMAVRCLDSSAMDIMRVALASGATTTTRIATACGEIFTEMRACV